MWKGEEKSFHQAMRSHQALLYLKWKVESQQRNVQ